MAQEKVPYLQNPCWRTAQIPPAAGGGEFLVAPSAVPAPSSRSQPDSRALAAPSAQLTVKSLNCLRQEEGHQPSVNTGLCRAETQGRIEKGGSKTPHVQRGFLRVGRSQRLKMKNGERSPLIHLKVSMLLILHCSSQSIRVSQDSTLLNIKRVSREESVRAS